MDDDALEDRVVGLTVGVLEAGKAARAGELPGREVVERWAATYQAVADRLQALVRRGYFPQDDPPVASPPPEPALPPQRPGKPPPENMPKGGRSGVKTSARMRVRAWSDGLVEHWDGEAWCSGWGRPLELWARQFPSLHRSLGALIGAEAHPPPEVLSQGLLVEEPAPIGADPVDEELLSEGLIQFDPITEARPVDPSPAYPAPPPPGKRKRRLVMPPVHRPLSSPPTRAPWER